MSQPSSELLIRIECSGLKSMDVLSASDPFVVFRINNVEIGRTEKIKNNNNPVFQKTFQCKYFFEKSQECELAVYDSDDNTSNLSHQDFIGKATAPLSEIASKGIWTSKLICKDKGDRGAIKVVTEEITGKSFDIEMKISGVHLDKKDFFGKSDPYLMIYQLKADNKVLVYKTETIMNTLDPIWAKIKIDSMTLCSNNLDTALIFECYDWDSNSDPDLIGIFRTTVNEIKGKKTFDLLNSKKVTKKGYVNSGQIIFNEFIIDEKPSFLDYLVSGCEISLMVAIDFTGSNGDPKQSDSLHHIGPTPNEYLQAITSVGMVLEPYDADRMFPVFGFGAKLADGKVYHDFNCNLNPNDPNVQGIHGIQQAYISSLNYVSLWGPTNFSPIIKKVINIIKGNGNTLKYYILLILTDGEITDMGETVDAIVEASDLPLSIVIIGVGSSNFKNMEILDGDQKGLKSSRGKSAARDIVQFVPFRTRTRTQENLSEEVLGEIPTQLLSYMKSKGILPKKQ